MSSFPLPRFQADAANAEQLKLLVAQHYAWPVLPTEENAYLQIPNDQGRAVETDRGVQ